MNQISPLAFVHPEAKLGDNNIIGPFCYIDKDTVLGDNNVLQNSVTIHVGARIGNNNEFFPGASISTKPQDLKFKGEVTTCEVGDNNSIRENVTISRGTASKGKTVVGSNNLLMETVHVAHDCVLGSGLIIGNSTKFAGEVVVDDNAIVSANVLVHQFCHIAGYVMIQGGCRFSQDIPPYIIAGGKPVKYAGPNTIIMEAAELTEKVRKHIANAYRLVFHGQTSLFDAINQIKDQVPDGPEIQNIIQFLESSQKGVITKM